MKNIIYTTSLIISLLFSTNLYADYREHNIQRQYNRQHHFIKHFKARIHNQQQRIVIGCDEGWLSARQTSKIQYKHEKLYQLKHEFWEDGHLSRRERHVLNDRLDRISQKLNEYKHHHYLNHRRDNYAYNAYRTQQQEPWYRNQRDDYGRAINY